MKKFNQARVNGGSNYDSLSFTLGEQREPEKGTPSGRPGRETNPVAGKGCQKVWYHPTAESKRNCRGRRRTRSTAGSKGNQPRPWPDPQGTEGCSTLPPFNDCKGVGRSASAGRLKVQSSPRQAADRWRKRDPLSPRPPGQRLASFEACLPVHQRKVAKCLVI